VTAAAAAAAGSSSGALQGGNINHGGDGECAPAGVINGHVSAVEAAAAGLEAAGDAEAVHFDLLCSVDKAHELDVNCVAWHPKDPGLLVSAGDDGVLKLWRLHNKAGEC
jgi:WD40 repeat protein